MGKTKERIEQDREERREWMGVGWVEGLYSRITYCTDNKIIYVIKLQIILSCSNKSLFPSWNFRGSTGTIYMYTQLILKHLFDLL